MSGLPSDRVWFPVKADCTWLWDLPTCWQGWAVVIGWWLTLILGIVYLPVVGSPGMALPVFVAAMFALLAAVCYAKGDKLRIWG